MAVETAPRREQLIEDLIDLFLVEGFLDFRVEQLAAHLRCSKSTVYAIAPSKDEIVTTVVRAFFKRATERIDEQTGASNSARDDLTTYLKAIATELEPASQAFISDVEAFEPAREIYRRNTEAASRRVQGLVARSAMSLDANFVGVAAGLMMEAIQRGDIHRATGLDDSQAYLALADLLSAGLS